jgi:hypothetical protein
VEGDDGVDVGEVGEEEELEGRMDEVGIEVVGGLGSSEEGQGCDLEPSDFEKVRREESAEEAEEGDDASLVIRAHTGSFSPFNHWFPCLCGQFSKDYNN